jgi:hypothetical protein
MTYQSPYPPQQYQPGPPVPQRQKAAGISIGALVVGILAFLVGLVPVLGLVLAVVGIVLGLLALRRPGRGLGVTGLILSALALLTNIAVILFVVLVPWGSIVDGFERGLDEAVEEQYGAPDDSADDFETQSVDTPCHSFDGPAGFIDNLGAEAVENCSTTLELWGEVEDDGTVTNTGVGAVWGSVNVEPIRSATSDEHSPDGSVDGMVEWMSTDYIPAFGEVLSLREPVTLDGAEGNLTRVESDQELTQTKALIIVKAPSEYQVDGDPARFFLVTFVTPYDNGEELIQTAVDSWRWN